MILLLCKMAQWMRSSLSLHGLQFDSWSGGIPQATEQLSPRAAAAEPVFYSLLTTARERLHTTTRQSPRAAKIKLKLKKKGTFFVY